MPFTSETAKRFRGPGGRKRVDPIKKAAAIIAREYIEAHVQPVLDTYLGPAAGQIVTRETDDGKQEFELRVDPATTRHAIDKILPDEQTEATRAIQIAFVQFNNHNSAQLQAAHVSTAVLA